MSRALIDSVRFFGNMIIVLLGFNIDRSPAKTEPFQMFTLDYRTAKQYASMNVHENTEGDGNMLPLPPPPPPPIFIE